MICLRTDRIPVRDKIAAMLLDRDEDGFIDMTSANGEWARNFIAAHQAAEHCGDCTNVPMSCCRCACDRVFADADKILLVANEQ